eukprot:TRINITY_DN12751_c0_g1_i2.p1 TRINITY_DN12751_c0_g1~~TRINITY_DN12751_c0_g1_i2.p1  ORF type:complete len:549 (-),score=67.25 TRINITY_DN12751_c0_g1_i2:58-1704(-)
MQGHTIGALTLSLSYIGGIGFALALVRACRDLLWHGLLQLEFFTGCVIVSTFHPAALLQIGEHLPKYGGCWWTLVLTVPLLRCIVMAGLVAWAVWKQSFPVPESWCIALLIANGIGIMQLLTFADEVQEDQTSGRSVQTTLATLEAQDILQQEHWDPASRAALEQAARLKHVLTSQAPRLNDLASLRGSLDSLPSQEAEAARQMMTAIDNDSLQDVETCLAAWHTVGFAERVPLMVQDVKALIAVATLLPDAWTEVACMNAKRSSFAAAVLDGHLYALGGYDGSATLASVERFDAKTNTWSFVANMTSRRQGLSAAVLDGKLYALGGHDGRSKLDSVERYDPNANTWTIVSRMGSARSYLGAVVFEGHLYALGGGVGVEFFEPKFSSWTEISAEWPGHGPSAAVLDGHLYALGQLDPPHDTCCKFDLKTSSSFTRTQAPSMNKGRKELAAVALDGQVYAIGGYYRERYRGDSWDNVLKSVERFNPKTGHWTGFASMGHGRYGLASAMLDGHIYALGGRASTTNGDGSYLSSVEKIGRRRLAEIMQEFV